MSDVEQNIAQELWDLLDEDIRDGAMDVLRAGGIPVLIFPEHRDSADLHAIMGITLHKGKPLPRTPEQRERAVQDFIETIDSQEGNFVALLIVWLDEKNAGIFVFNNKIWSNPEERKKIIEKVRRSLEIADARDAHNVLHLIKVVLGVAVAVAFAIIAYAWYVATFGGG
jgi:hypothetical protein